MKKYYALDKCLIHQLTFFDKMFPKHEDIGFDFYRGYRYNPLVDVLEMFDLFFYPNYFNPICLSKTLYNKAPLLKSKFA